LQTGLAGLSKNAFKAAHPLGSGTSTKVKTGQADTLTLTLDQAGQTCLQGRLNDRGAILIVVVPEGGRGAVFWSRERAGGELAAAGHQGWARSVN
jgi:hypothetical protein